MQFVCMFRGVISAFIEKIPRMVSRLAEIRFTPDLGMRLVTRIGGAFRLSSKSQKLASHCGAGSAYQR